MYTLILRPQTPVTSHITKLCLNSQTARRAFLNTNQSTTGATISKHTPSSFYCPMLDVLCDFTANKLC